MATHAYRFGLGSITAAYSGLWRVWTHEDEVHLAVSTASDDVALTAYPTGRWRIAIGAAVSRWTRPKEFRPGWTRGPDLLIPYSSVPIRPAVSDPFAKEPVTWLAPPAPGFLARFTMLLASPRAEESIWRPLDTTGTEGVVILPLRRAGAVHLCRSDEPLPADGSTQLPPTDAPSLLSLSVTVSADQLGRPSLIELHHS